MNYYFSSVEEHFKFLIRKMKTSIDARRIFLSITWSYQYHLRVMCSTMVIFIPYYCAGSVNGGDGRSLQSRQRMAEKQFRVNTSIIHLMVLTQTYVSFQIFFSCSRLTGRFNRQERRAVETPEPGNFRKPAFISYLVHHLIWIVAFLFYIQILSSCFNRPKHLAALKVTMAEVRVGHEERSNEAPRILHLFSEGRRGVARSEATVLHLKTSFRSLTT